MTARALPGDSHIVLSLKLLAFTLLSFAASEIGYQFTMVGPASMIWPPSGVNLAIILLFGWRMWPAIALGSFLSFVTHGLPPIFLVADVLANTAEPLVGAYLLRRAGFEVATERLQDVVALLRWPIFAAACGSGLVGASALILAGMAPPSAWSASWLTWWLGDAVGILVLTPLLLSWGTRGEERPLDERLPELLALGAVLAAVMWITFARPLVTRGESFSLAFLAVPVIIWSAVRFGQRGAVTSSALVTATAVASTSLNVGPFAHGDYHIRLLLVWLFAVVCSLTALVLGATVSERDRGQEALRISEERYRALYLKAPVMLHSHDNAGKLLAVSDTWYSKMGYQRGEVIGAKITDFLDKNSKAVFRRAIFGEGSIHDKVYSLPLRFVGKKGEVFDAELSATHERDAEGLICETLAVVVDVSERKRAESAVSRAMHILQSAQEMVISITPEGWVVDVNPAACRQLGRERGALLSSRVEQWVEGTSPQALRELVKRVNDCGPCSVEATMRRHDGSRFPAEIDISSFHVEGRETICLFARDTTTRRRIEQKERHSQKLAAVGALAGGVAHDFNNSLGIILGNVAIAKGQLPPSSPVLESLEAIEVATRRGSDVVRKLMAFARPQDRQRRTLAVEQSLEGVASLLGSVLPSSVQVRTSVTTPSLRICADSVEILQVLVNLGTNAGKAMGSTGGILSFSASAEEIDAQMSLVGAGLQPGPFVRIRVTDTGCGMSEAQRARAFEPFYSAWPGGEGTGLGLAVVDSVVTELGGAVEVFSEAGEGTSVVLHLPRVMTPPPESYGRQ